jgi:2-dehydro-3-deoxygluconokinase
MSEVVTLGECLIAFVADEIGPLADATTFHRFVAGAEANLAVGLSRLGHSAAYVGRVGGDGFGTAIVRHLRGEGVDVTQLTVDEEAATGLMFRERRALGPANVIYTRRHSAGSRLTTEDVEAAVAAGVFEGARWLHLTGITPALSADARDATERAAVLARANRMTVSLDLNLRRRLWSDAEAGPVLQALAGQADVILGSPDEFAAICDTPHDATPTELARAALALGPTLSIVKLGAEGGSLAATRDEVVQRPAVPLPVVVDPVGAGDAFCAGFIAARLDGAGLPAALDAGNACGAAAAAALGDQTGLLDRAELDGLLAAAAGSRTHDTIR